MATPADSKSTETQALAVAEPKTTTLYHTPEAEQFQMEQRMARLFVQSGLFSDVKGATAEQAIAQAYVKIAMGKSMGFSPAESMQGIDIIQGRPAVSAQLRAARMQRAGFSWKIERLDDHGCELTVYFGGNPIGRADFVEEDARRMGLTSKDNWRKDPQSMYFARAVTRAQRRYAPGVLSADIMSREEVFDIPAEEMGQRAVEMPRRASERILSAEAETSTQTATDDTGGDSTSGAAQASTATVPPTIEASGKPSESPAPQPSEAQQKRLLALKDLRNDVGGQAFNRILGSNGCENIQDAVASRDYDVIIRELREEKNIQAEERKAKAQK